jgi:hypothetical protein
MSNREIRKQKQEKSRFKTSSAETRLDNAEYPVFCFRDIQSSYCITNCSNDERAQLVITLYNISKLTWNQVYGTHSKGMGCERIPYYRINAEIPKYISKDTTFLSFRFTQANRFVGYRDGNVFILLWIGEPYSH